MKVFNYCEYHIDLEDLEMGTFHVLTEDHLPDVLIERLKDGIKQLSFQYGNVTLKCIEYIDIEFLDDSNVPFALSDGEVYLLNASDYMEHCKKTAADYPQIYIMSHDLYFRFRERTKSKNHSLAFESLIQEVYEREGLLYGIIMTHKEGENPDVQIQEVA